MEPQGIGIRIVYFIYWYCNKNNDRGEQVIWMRI